ncbi:MAG: zinc-binding alcohol dehydrogenase family protein [Acidobacteriaceae bacterium]|nr:zinc-binding alcohol dehydrogenase family protein [Acidobacteriaceae bacterium]MBV8570708.1 zinc-binding alcohol dehydrogenase family protein [Acidobacteriaceae bacterium]
MNAAVVHAFDAPPRYTSFAEPVPADGEFIVTLIAAGLHPIVKALATGSHYSSAGVLPFIPGVDGVGEQQDGGLVYFGMSRAPFGTFAERCLAARKICIPVPENLDPVMVAGIVNPGMSSWVALTRRAELVAGENVLILGATGTAGQLAVQIAKHLGAQRVMAAGRNRAILQTLTDLGADATVALDQDHDSLVSSIRHEWMAFGIDVVLDYLWGPPAQAVLEAISQRSPQRDVSPLRFVQVGESAGKTISLPAALLRSTAIELRGSGFGSASMDQIFKALSEFFHMLPKSPLKIKVSPVPLRDVEALWNSTGQGTRYVFVP